MDDTDFDQIYQEAFEAGKEAGYQTGYDEGYEIGDDEGHEVGYEKGEDSGYEAAKYDSEYSDEDYHNLEDRLNNLVEDLGELKTYLSTSEWKHGVSPATFLQNILDKLNG